MEDGYTSVMRNQEPPQVSELLIGSKEVEKGQFMAIASIGLQLGAKGVSHEDAVQNLVRGLEAMFASLGMRMETTSMIRLGSTNGKGDA